MRTASIQELKQELTGLSPAQLAGLCLRLARFKKENKELLTYLLFEAHDEQGYIGGVKQEMELLFTTINQTSLYFAKKTIRKILRIANKYARYSGSATVETELLLHFCTLLQHSGIAFRQHAALSNLYEGQIKKINKVVQSMHPDLQHDYQKALQRLS